MLASLMLITLGANPVKLAAPGLNTVNLAADLGEFYAAHLAQHMARDGLRVVTASEIATLVGLERQKQLLGCAEDAQSCMAELANALGADGLVSGSIGKFGEEFQINLKVISAADATEMAAFSSRVSGETQVLDELSRGARQMGAEVLARLRPASNRPMWWLPGAAGIALAGVGTGFAIAAQGSANQLRNEAAALDYDAARSIRDRGQRQELVSILGLALGTAGLAASGAWYYGSSGSTATAGLSLVDGGAVVSLGARWP